MGNVLTTESAALFDAIAGGDVTAAVRALEAHPGLSHKRALKKNRTVYHACASTGQVEVLRRLCEHVWRTLPDELGKTHPGPDSIPEGRFHPVIFRAVNSYDESGLTPLMLACKKGHTGAVQYLLSQGADPWIGDRLLGRSALHMAARANQPGCIDAVLSSPFVELDGRVRSKQCRLVDFPSSSGYAPLHYAATSRAADAADALLLHGANPNAKSFAVGFDFLQLDRGSTPLHAAARNQNLDFAMALLRHWDQRLRHLDVTDPRVVENYERVKPYQMSGVKANKALARVLDPATPIRDISDPFGECQLLAQQQQMGAVSLGKVAPVALKSQRSLPSTRQQGQDSCGAAVLESCGGTWSSGDKMQAPPGWEDILSSSKVAIGGKGGSDFVTVYQCAEFAADYGSVVPPAGDIQRPNGASAACGRTLLRTQSDGRRIVLGGGAAAAAAGSDAASPAATAATGLGRTRSGAVNPTSPGMLGGRGSHNSGFSSSSDEDLGGRPAWGRRIPSQAKAAVVPAPPPPTGGGIVWPPYKPPPYAQAAGTTGDAAMAPPRSSGDGAAGASPFASAATSPASPSGWQLSHRNHLQPGTPPRGDLTSSTPGFPKPARSSFEHVACAAATAAGGAAAPSRTASVPPPEPSPKPSSPDGGKSHLRSFARSLSKKFGGGDAAAATTTAAAATAATAAAAGNSRGSSPQGSLTDGSAAVPPPTAFSAWGEDCAAACRPSGANPKDREKDKAGGGGDALPDFTRDSHAEDAHPVVVTMYPHTRVNLQPLKAGDTCNVALGERYVGAGSVCTGATRGLSSLSATPASFSMSMWPGRRRSRDRQPNSLQGQPPLHHHQQQQQTQQQQQQQVFKQHRTLPRELGAVSSDGSSSSSAGGGSSGFNGAGSPPVLRPNPMFDLGVVGGGCGINLSRQGLLPVPDLSEDESQMEDAGRAAKALSPTTSCRTLLV